MRLCSGHTVLAAKKAVMNLHQTVLDRVHHHEQLCECPLWFWTAQCTTSSGVPRSNFAIFHLFWLLFCEWDWLKFSWGANFPSLPPHPWVGSVQPGNATPNLMNHHHSQMTSVSTRRDYIGAQSELFLELLRSQFAHVCHFACNDAFAHEQGLRVPKLQVGHRSHLKLRGGGGGGVKMSANVVLIIPRWQQLACMAMAKMHINVSNVWGSFRTTLNYIYLQWPTFDVNWTQRANRVYAA